jgi:hypothetical protein
MRAEGHVSVPRGTLLSLLAPKSDNNVPFGREVTTTCPSAEGGDSNVPFGRREATATCPSGEGGDNNVPFGAGT